MENSLASTRSNGPPDGPRGADPPEEYEPSSSTTTKGASNNSYQHRHPTMTTPSRHHRPYYPTTTKTKTTTMRHQLRDEFVPGRAGRAAGGGASSRDDDSTGRHSAQFSAYNNGNDGGGIIGAGKISTTLAIGRLWSSDIDSTLEALNAKSRALRGITHRPTPSSSSSSINAPTHPPPQRSSHAYSSRTKSNEGGVRSHPRPTGRERIQPVDTPAISHGMSNESVDYRLKFLTLQSLELRKNSPCASSSASAGGGTSWPSSPKSVATPFRAPAPVGTSFPASNKKVIFEADCAGESRLSAHDDRSFGAANIFTDDSRSVGNRRSFVDQWNDIPPSSAFSTASSVVAPPPGSVSATSASSATESPPHPAGVTSGTTVAHAARWNASAGGKTTDIKKDPPYSRSLAMNILCAKILGGYTMTRNHCPKCTMSLLKEPGLIASDRDGSIVAASAKSANISPREECAYCPIEKLRTTITEAVSNRIAATGLPPGAAGVGDIGGGIVALSDAVCVEIAREEGRGGALADNRWCAECGGPELFRGDGSTKCTVCDVINMKLGDGYRRSTAEENYDRGTSPVPSIHRMNRSSHPSSASAPIPKVPSFTSSTYDLTQSPSIKSNVYASDHSEVDFAQLQSQIEEQRAKVMEMQKSCMNPAAENQAISQTAPTGAGQEPSEQDIVTSQFIKSTPAMESQKSYQTAPSAPDQGPAEEEIAKSGGDGIPINLAKLQDKLNKVVKRLGKFASAPDISPASLSKLQSQLKEELAKAKESQAALELTLQSSHVAATDDKAMEDIFAELEKAKKDQITLEKIIEGTNFIEKATSDDPGLATSVTEELLAASRNHSYSISQQEVDRTGNAKEYIPPPSYFQANIPSEIVVYHIPEVPGCEQSVAAQSHHTQNLKRSERNLSASRNSADCCGGSAGLFGQHSPAQTPQQQDDDYYDCETIETDDYSAEYTLNTMDDSRLMRYHVDIDDGFDKKTEANVNHSSTKAKKSKLFFFCFDCGADDDVYSMVESSKRGITIMDQEDSKQPLMSNVNEHYLQGDRQRSSSPVVHDSQYHDGDGNAGHHTPPGSVDDSDIGSMRRIGREVIAKRTCFVNSTGREVIAKQMQFRPVDGNTRPPSVLHVGGQGMEGRMRSPSPLSDWDSVNNGSDLGSINLRYASPDKPQPKSILRMPPPRYSDHYSVQSDLTDLSSINRKVTFGSIHIDGRTAHFGQARRGRWSGQQPLRALTEESGSTEIAGSFS